MLFSRQKLFSSRFKLLLGLLAFLSICLPIILYATKARAASNLSISYFSDGHNPDSYGPEVFTTGEYRYIYDVGFFSDNENIDPSTVAYEIDSEGRQSLAGNVTYDGGTEVDVRLVLDQIPYADGSPHTITFSASTVDAQEVTDQKALQPTPDTTNPDLYVDTYQSGTITDTYVHFIWSISDYHLTDYGAYLDNAALFVSPFESGPDYANYDIDVADTNPGVLDGNNHTLRVFATDPYGNTSEQSYTFRYDNGMGGGNETDPPVFNFTSETQGNAGNPLHYEGSVTDASIISSVQYSIDFASRQTVTTTGTDTNKSFSIDLPNQTAGAHNVQFFATDEWGNQASSTLYEVDIDTEPPVCTGMVNLSSPYYSTSLAYVNIHCTDNRGITHAAYNVYHSVQGTLQDFADHSVPAKDGSFDSGDETFDFTVDLTGLGDIDGNIFVGFRSYDAAGNYSNDYDPITIELTDNTAPVINLDQVAPDPLTDHTPALTGSCKDATPRETNTNISLMEYKVDAGSYSDITLPDSGSYNDSTIESFSFDLPTLANGAHTVTIRCTDGASHSSTASDNFTIQDPILPVPGDYTFTESFDDTGHQDIPNSSNIVWGNGKLRLKEEFNPVRTAINTTEPCDKYGECRGNYGIWQDPVDSNVIWYNQFGKIYTYNTQTNTNTQFDYVTDYSLSQLGDLKGFSIGVYQGKKYLFMSDIYRLDVINLTDHTSFEDSSFHDVVSIAIDTTRGRLGAYMTLTATGGNSNLAYLDLNGTMTEGDDTLTPIPLSKLNSTNFLNILLDPTNNAIYSGTYGDGFFKFGDNNDPSNTAAYQATIYDDGIGGYVNVFSGMALDPQNRLIFGTANVSNARIYVVTDDGGTPFDATDDTVTQIATPQQLGYHNIYGIQYIVGQNGVGDQLLLTTESDNPIYLNFNDTYTNLSDDTFIEVEARGGMRPGAVSAYIKDYNTMYVEVKNQGFFKVELNRGWVNSGEAVALPTRPPQQLVVDNFTAEATVATPISYLPSDDSQNFLSQLGRAIVPQVQAAGEGIHYFVSTDGGVTYTEVTLGQLQQLQQSDFRVKFKIQLDEVGGASPLLNSYSLAYAGYPDPSQPETTTGLSVSPSTTTTTVATNFSTTIEAVDVLGYKTASYNGSAALSLIDAGSNTVVSGLNTTSATITNGTVTVSGLQIAQAGSYKIRVTSGSFTQDSSTITISGGVSLTSPTLAFYADRYKIKKGEDLTLHWNSTNLDTFIINPGDAHLTASAGDFIVHPQSTTTYTITGDGSHGTASNSLTVVVEGEVSSNSSSSDTATASAAAQLAASPGLTTLNTGNPLTITSSSDQTIVRGQKAEVSWDVPDADEVTISYPETHVVSSKGSFEFYPIQTTRIVITATKGQESVEKTILITVLNVPIQAQELSRAIQEKLPWSTPIVSAVIQTAKSVPVIGLTIASIAEVEIVTLLVVTVISQAGFLAALNGKTLLNIFATAGILPAKQRKGFIHQTKDGTPIPFAAISVYEGAQRTGAPFVTLVSDMYGSYVEPFLPKGLYTLIAGHAEHAFPTKYPRPKHLGVKDFYKGEALAVTSEREHQSLLIPMDEVDSATARRQLRYKILLMLQRTLSSLQWTVYPLSVVSLIALWLNPNVFNLIVVAIYAIMLIPKLLKRFKKPALQGKVIMDLDRKPVQNATLTLSTTDGNVVAVSKSDDKGNYRFFAPKGTYALNVVSNNLMWKEQAVGTLYTIKVGENTKPFTASMQAIENPF